MTTQAFDTPEPIAVDVSMAGGSLRVVAGSAEVTVVTVLPSNPDSESDAKAAAQTRVELDADRLRVIAPRRRGLRSFVGAGASTQVTLDVPAGSSVTITGWADTRCEGRLGAVDIDSGMGDITVEHSASLRAKSAMGDIVAGRVDGSTDAKTSAGSLRLDHAGGEAQLRTAMGDVAIGHAMASVTAKTSAGSISVGAAHEGSVRLTSAYGSLQVGIPSGTAAWLDTQARYGSITTDLQSADAPADDELAVEVHAHTQFGDITISRASNDVPEESR